ncbi:MAG: hypothetical protein Kow0029_11250 [Candidatus Rifleibacteriota bacterium]
MSNKPGASIPKRFLENPRTQAIMFLIALIYIISPIDFIPDTIPILGWMDDLTVFLAEAVSFILYLKGKRRDLRNANNSETNKEGTENGG